MASVCIRSLGRVASSSFRSCASISNSATRRGSRPSPAAAHTRIHRMASISRAPVELACCAVVSLLPLHSAVAAARLTSRLSSTSWSCRALSQAPVSKKSWLGHSCRIIRYRDGSICQKVTIKPGSEKIL